MYAIAYHLIKVANKSSFWDDTHLVIHTASGFDTAAAKALVLGLGQRKQATGKAVHYIHTSGTSNLGDQPITGKYYESHIFSDEENIYAYEKTRESQHTYAQRTTDLAVVETGLEQGVETHIIMSPTIYGIGTGNFNRQSIQIPTIIRSALKAGQAEAIGEGKGIWDYVHIADLAKLYEILLTKILNGEEVPSGEKGIIFSSSGRYSWAELSHGVADALFTLGAIKTRDVKSLTLEEAAEKWAGGLVFHAELGFASNSRTDSVVSRQLGWKPQKTVEDWKANFIEEARLII
ncbi:hypothetical protein G7Y89_g9763 [Cudoniella acicularis]|uniref:NAD-dependent epimerase/dehydratase domain-containing protein n=1 Tax=Cudoniella acicularis TaxID=354080 RepID=A0A8H4RGT8_9HELO|nr:hypothetical protein G7Y89_g9763 [Cudoniella acicularis]